MSERSVARRNGQGVQRRDPAFTRVNLTLGVWHRIDPGTPLAGARRSEPGVVGLLVLTAQANRRI